MIQAHLHVGIFMIIFVKHASLKKFFSDMKALQASEIFKERNNHEVYHIKISINIF